MFCKECGNKIGDNHKFCEYCGTPVDEIFENVSQEMQQVVPQPISPVEYQAQPQAQVHPQMQQVNPVLTNVESATSLKNAKSKKPFIIGGLILLLIIAAVATVLVLAKTGKIDIGLFNSTETEENNSEDDQTANSENTQTTDASEQGDTPVIPETEAPVYETETAPEPVVVSPEEALTEYASTFAYISLDGLSYRHEKSEYAYTAYPLENANGTFKTKLVDLDYDGVQELLVFDIMQNTTGEVACSDIHAIVYEYDGANVIQTADQVIVTDVFSIYDDTANLRISLKDNYYICVDYTSATFLEADGGHVDMELWKYDGAGAGLVQMAQLKESGSDWSEISAQCEVIRPALEEAGMTRTIEQLFTNWQYSFSMADSGMQAICKITADLDNYDYLDESVTAVNTVLAFIDEHPESDFIIGDSHLNPLDDGLLATLDENQLNLANCEIYARNGRWFDDADVQNYFNSKAWYLVPSCGYANPDGSTFTDIEKENIAKFESLNQ